MTGGREVKPRGGVPDAQPMSCWQSSAGQPNKTDGVVQTTSLTSLPPLPVYRQRKGLEPLGWPEMSLSPAGNFGVYL